jgi:GT2 family glycosyltransferase
MINFSIVIPTYKRTDLAFSLAQQILSLYPETEIVIIDQESKSKLTKNSRRIKYIQMDHANTSEAKNLGWQNASGEVILFFDDDLEITPETIPAHLKEYASPEVAGVAGRVIVDGETVPANTLVETGTTNFLGLKFLYQFWSTKKQFVDFPYGCNMSFRRSTLEKSGGFDPKFPKIFEEVDLGRRINNRIGKIVFSPQALAYHHKAISGGIRPEEQINKDRLIYLSYGRYLRKNIPFPFSVLSLLIRSRTAIKAGRDALKYLYQGYLVHSINRMD